MRIGKHWFQKVVFANECTPCDCCDDVICPECGEHYAECECPGPSQEDEFIYRVYDGVLYARRKSPREE